MVKSIHWGLLSKRVKCNKNYFIYLFIPFTVLLRLAYRSDPLMDFTCDSSKDVKSRKDVPFGVIKLKFNIQPLSILNA